MTNVFFRPFNDKLEFAKISAEQISEACIKCKELLNLELELIISSKNLNFENSFGRLDNLFFTLSQIVSPVYLMGSVHMDEDIRQTADLLVADLSKYQNEIMLNEDLYNCLKSKSELIDKKDLRDDQLKFITETIREFERNGFALNKDKRLQLKKIQDKLADLSIAFHKYIAEASDFISISEAEIDGLPEDFKELHLQGDGSYKISLDYPSYIPFMKYAKSDKQRKILYVKYLNKSKNKNLAVLKEILIQRKMMTKLLGYETYAAYQVENRMVKKPSAIWDFENKLSAKVKEKARKDYQELLEVKRNYSKNSSVDSISPWEKSFYSTQLLKQSYQLDSEETKQYFELQHVLDGMFHIVETIFAIKIRRDNAASVWHKDVNLYEIFVNDKLKGRCYLDLYPRDNKYNHAACFGICSGKESQEGYYIPTVALVCNFQKATATQPSLLYHSDVVTFFHEFGHALHSLLTEAKLSSYSGTSVVRDFVEAPSQFMENWAWNYDALKHFAIHHKTKEVLPESLFKKMIAAKNVGSGIDTQQQIFYGLLDMTYHDKYDPEGEISTSELVKELQNKHTYFPYLNGTAFETSFGHLDGYAAGYYGYLWSKVYAQDMFSAFESDIFSKEQGKRFREIILANGGQKDELDLVREFLGREPNEEAFLISLGV